MRIGISGAQSTGKTTLFHALAQTGILLDHQWAESPIQGLMQLYGLKLNEAGDNLSQTVIMDHLALNVIMNDHIVTDRTPLDSAVYTSILYGKKQVDPLVFLHVLKILEYAQPLYNLCFYLAPEFPIEARENRSTDPEFQQRFHEEAQEFHRDYGFPLTVLSGSVEERVQVATKAIKEVHAKLL